MQVKRSLIEQLASSLVREYLSRKVSALKSVFYKVCYI